MIADVDGHDVSILRLVPGLVATLTAPLALINLDDFLVTIGRLAGRIGDGVLEVDNGTFDGEEVGLLRIHAQLLVLDIVDCFVQVFSTRI